MDRVSDRWSGTAALIALLAGMACSSGCASIATGESIPPVVDTDAVERLPGAGDQRIDTLQIDFPLLAAAVLAESNRRRRAHQRTPLDRLPVLEAVSTMHAEDMVRHRFFNHVNPVEPSKRTVADRLALASLVGSFHAENIARIFALQVKLRSDRSDLYQMTVYPLDVPGQFSLTPDGPAIPFHTYITFARELVQSWMDSPAHRRNLLTRQARYLGCGCAHQVGEAGLPILVCVQVFYANFDGVKAGRLTDL